MVRFGGSVRLELAREAIASLRLQGRRSLLALLGVMIGAASIVALLSFSHIARVEVMSRFQQVGVDTVQISAATSGDGWMRADDLESLTSQIEGVRDLAALAVGRSPIRIGASTLVGTVAAVSPETFGMLSLAHSEGRGLSVVDGCNGAMLVGAKLAQEHNIRLNQEAYIDGYGYKIIGLLNSYPAQALSPVDPNETFFIGSSCTRRVMSSDGYSHALIKISADIKAEDWAQKARSVLSEQQLDLQVRTPSDLIAAMNSQMALMSAVLVAIGSVSLLVGGVGVMNVMLMSVMERRREIGLRAAIGATPDEIVFIFIIEAVALSIGGGFLGAIAGVGLTWLGCAFLPIQFAFDPAVLLWGTGIAAAVGLIFGIHPAVSASRILPVEALRAD